jgi:hypothetical protein
MATILFADSGIANNNKDFIKADNEIDDNFCRPKNGWYYAGVDAGGAWAWGSAGSALGPLGTAAGAVLGGLCTTTWAFHWENRSASIPVNHPKDEFVNSYKSEFERCGYLHNKFCEEFININQATYKSTKEFMDEFYNPLCIMVSKEYDIDINKLKKAFPKELLIENLNNYTELSSIENDYKVIIKMGEIVKAKTNSTEYSNYYLTVMQALYELSNNTNFNIEEFIKNEINNVDTSKSFSEEEKIMLKNSLNVMKYSFALWTSNQ